MRLIDADALIKDIESVLWDWESVDGINAKTVLTQTITDIQNAPTVDAVEVVRCKDCKHRTELCGDGWHPCTDMAVNDNWYCADGERREDDN